MQHPLQITFRNVPKSEAMVQAISERVERLHHFFDGLIGCRVLVETPHHHHSRGKAYALRIDLTVPGHLISVGREGARHLARQDAYVAIRDAFKSVQRQLKDYVSIRRGFVKHHETPTIYSHERSNYNRNCVEPFENFPSDV